MPKRSSKRSSDLNVNAFNVVQAITGDMPKKKPEAPANPAKNAAAVALGRLGGLKGGKARAKKLSAEQRTMIAQKAARSRWKKKRQS